MKSRMCIDEYLHKAFFFCPCLLTLQCQISLLSGVASTFVQSLCLYERSLSAVDKSWLIDAVGDGTSCQFTKW